jgi:hypothetical protein
MAPRGSRAEFLLAQLKVHALGRYRFSRGARKKRAQRLFGVAGTGTANAKRIAAAADLDVET